MKTSSILHIFRALIVAQISKKAQGGKEKESRKHILTAQSLLLLYSNTKGMDFGLLV